MNKSLTTLTILTFSSLLSVNTVADDRQGFYASGSVGVGFLGSENLSYQDSAVSSTEEADFNPSFTGGGAIGYYLKENIRLEGEVMYRRNEMEALTIDGIGASTEGDFASLGFGLSALYDFRPVMNDRLSFYAGAGVVFVQEIDIDFEVDGNEIEFETDETGFQLQFGGRYDVNERVFIDAGIRYLAVSGAKLEFPADSSRTVEADYSPVSLMIGAGWRF
ncbi:MAG: outer membrane protein [Gammaproteobacteria bacterium]